MARKRASMREGPLAELFRKTEAAQRGQEDEPGSEPAQAQLSEPDPRAAAAFEETVEHVPDFAKPEATPVEPPTSAAPAVVPEPIREEPKPGPAPTALRGQPSDEEAASRAAARYFRAHELGNDQI